MKKITLLAVSLLTTAFTANAQYNVSGHRFFDNWSIGVDGGITTNLHDFDTPHGGVAGIQLTKGITPVIGIQAEVTAGFNNWTNWNVSHSDCVVDNVAALLMTKVNLMNWFGGYNGKPRVFEISPKAGIGYMHYFYPDGTQHNVGRVRNAGTFKAGIDFDFNVGKQRAWTLSIKPAVLIDVAHANETPGATTHYHQGAGSMWGCDNCVGFWKNNEHNQFSHAGVFQLTAGVTYHFRTSNKKHHFVEVQPAVVEKIVEKVVEKPVEKVKGVYVDVPVATSAATYVVEFAQNKSVLTGTAKAVLNEVPSNATVTLDAYASPEGAKAYNKKLSERRAEEVKKYLESRGIKVAGVNAHGAESNSSNRMVYVRVK